MALAATALAWWIWSSVSSYQAQAETQSRSIRMIELRGRILQLDEVLTMSARMMAATGDPAWERRYNEFDPQLAAAIDEICELARGAGFPPMAVETREANERLVALERQSFRWVAENRRADALRLLSSPDYEQQKVVYSNGMLQLSAGLQRALDERLAGAHRRTTVSVSLAALLLAAIAWMIIVLARRSTRRDQALLGELARKLRVSEERFKCLVDADVIGITVVDTTGTLIEANDAFLRTAGYSREELATGRLRWPELTPVDANVAAFLQKSGRVPAIEKELLRKDGSRVPTLVGMVRIHGGKDETVCFVLDITERKRLEAQLGQSQKMETVGLLAGGISHDFNNLLCAINGFTSLALEQLPATHTARPWLVEVEKAGQRASALTRQLLAFSRRQVLQPKVIDVGAIVMDMHGMIRRLIGENIDLQVIRCQEPCHVLADPGQLQQVIMNLVVNARDAMPSGGTLTIETTCSAGSPPQAVIRVTDTGVGMNEATRSRLFEPFFTTKGLGRGTGLGLSMVYGIVKQSGGDIAVQSRPDEGSTFTIQLPLIAPRTPTVRVESGLPGGGTETILLVEDEDQVRRLASAVLKGRGYRVVEAVDGRVALETLRERGREIDLLVSDVVMPNMGGKELVRHVREWRPDLSVLLMSGYAETQLSDEELKSSAFLQKPFTAESLASAVRAGLDARPAR
jgi:hypothetical protein